ncbi:hypothetical protein Q361_1401 [Flavobacterium croceum DSM 17960]|uniref:Carboxypeptidase-like protein n=1 Tax=Flavobacterium croceum DSM 17960 TaxID=1121886 RepID=A0A2S4N5R2_9FLAO|nr:hypothetical protein [Flavobacterium croceum]POS00623.1 hypothetical protein Q361_1401 [Flavobacterium croceum DSM 17960]
MKNLKKAYLIILIVFINLFISCDCLQNGSGIIVDEETKKPINNVEIKEVGKDFIQHSDENGYFEIHHISGGLFSCSDITIIVSKKEYISDTIEIKNGEDKLIKLFKLK